MSRYFPEWVRVTAGIAFVFFGCVQFMNRDRPSHTKSMFGVSATSVKVRTALALLTTVIGFAFLAWSQVKS